MAVFSVEFEQALFLRLLRQGEPLGLLGPDPVRLRLWTLRLRDIAIRNPELSSTELYRKGIEMASFVGQRENDPTTEYFVKSLTELSK